MDTQQLKTLEDFFKEVFELKIDLSDVVFPPTSEGYISMVNPPPLSHEKALEGLITYFTKYAEVIKLEKKIIAGTWLKPCAENFFPTPFQERPAGFSSFSYLDTSAPDSVGVSQQDVIESKVSFMNSKEYILATAFRFFRTKSFLDPDGSTVTILSERWNYGNVDSGMVYGFFRDNADYSGVCLFNGPPEQRITNAGPRKIIIVQ